MARKRRGPKRRTGQRTVTLTAADWETVVDLLTHHEAMRLTSDCDCVLCSIDGGELGGLIERLADQALDGE